MKKIAINKSILSANDLVARENRAIFDKHGALVLNIISSPGSGKTSLIENILKNLKDRKVVIIEGDIAGNLDARRLARIEPNVLQINTGSACHLDARMIRSTLDFLPSGVIDIILIENVGNLVCPAEFKVGENAKVVILSVAEGDDKPLKYPLVFQLSSLLIINKIDLLPYTNFNLNRAKQYAKKINPKIDIIEVSCSTGDGIKDIINWINKRI